MRVFVTGATGFVGSAVVQELIRAGHQVIGLTRSDRGAEELEKAGAQVHLGALENVDSLHSGAVTADGVIHLAFRHEGGFADFEKSLSMDLAAVEAMGAALEGTGKPFIITNHMNGTASENALFKLNGVRTSLVSLAPSVHGKGDKAFIPALIDIARRTGISAYVGDGANRWPAVHRLDAAQLYRLTLEKAPAGSKLHGRAEEGVVFRDIASVIGKHLSLPVVSISQEEAQSHFGLVVPIAAMDVTGLVPGSSALAKELVGWEPVQPGLIEDLEEGHYFNR